MVVKKIVTIAGSDSLAGGGIQADLATFDEYGYQGLSAITSIVTVIGDDFQIHPVDLELVLEQLKSIFALDDIAAIKIGLLPTADHVKLVADFLKQQGLTCPIVVDPVMAFKETDTVDVHELVTSLRRDLLPLATITTPNLTEAELLTGKTAESVDDLIRMGQQILQDGPNAVLVKGGARLADQQIHDVLVQQNGAPIIMNQERIPAETNNGAGCTLSSAVASGLGDNQAINVAVKDAQTFVHDAIADGVPLNHDFKVGNVWQGARRMKNGKVNS
ncbi:pyridoxine kinase [Weissella uvarum]|uniref:bifunctional hydroxymethylpyrimidine kinase/phosphomethylpyrimidine kinase n=1 Tax=Weissella uvarum TaxID=1479233 RepID=UPI00196021CE|nr:hydroxymethylpyrimidine/phosphomethylpyrimidine kinase [Weissella uvarum]MBM7617059.1 pyridoxine kinase [Weissella uvarum]MCM0595357.1 hydroxymethylpyrimidine/phosphomethylpyrimidine kinase [Weissella uvarum]